LKEVIGGSVRSYPDRRWTNPVDNITPHGPRNSVDLSLKNFAAGNVDLDARI